MVSADQLGHVSSRCSEDPLSSRFLADRFDRVSQEEATVNMENSESGDKDRRLEGHVCRFGTNID